MFTTEWGALAPSSPDTQPDALRGAPMDALAVAALRERMPLFALPAPDALSPAVTALVVEQVRSSGVHTLALATALTGWQHPDTRQRLDKALRVLPTAPALARSADPHDAYFHIARTEGDPGAAFLRGIVAALALWLDEVASPEELIDHAAIGDALLELWLRALDLDALPVNRTVAPRSAAATQEPVQRWLRGHHIFAVLTQGLVWTLEQIQALDEQAPADTVIDLLGLMTRLYRASAAAFRFTAHFDPEVYADVIRPSMSEPHVPPGFSGSMSVDHGHLVALLSRSKGLMATFGARFPHVYAGLREALTEVYDCHRHVCERFVSPEGPSLRTDRLCGDNAAVTMIDRFKARRLDMLR